LSFYQFRWLRKKQAMARGAILLDNEVLFLWEWLSATIIAVRRGGLPQD
jgi:hypothetical protein